MNARKIIGLITTYLRLHFPILILIGGFSLLFFFRLGTLYLENWDEAWYGSITKEMLNSRDFIHLMWNGVPFVDHPPTAMWFMALSYIILGISEFSTRFPSALMGVLSIVLVYLLSYELFKKRSVAFISSLILGSCIWYILRVRSGNLDSTLIFFYALTGYLALRSARNIKLLPVTFFSYALLILSKTLVGLPMLFLIIFWNYKHIKRPLWILASAVLFILVVGLWYIPNILSNPLFIERHFFEIGLREKGAHSFLNIYLTQNLFYLQNGIAKWYYPFLLSLPLSVILVAVNTKRKELLFILLWFFLVASPFFTSEQTQIWHLIPVYIPIALLVPYVIYKYASIIKFKFFSESTVVFIGVVLCILNLKAYYKNIFPTERYIPDEVAVSEEAGKHESPIYLNGEFVPRAVFYSGKTVSVFAYKPDALQTLIATIKTQKTKPVIITKSSSILVLKAKKISTRMLLQNGDLVVLQVR